MLTPGVGEEGGGQAEPWKQERMTGASSPFPDPGINSRPPALSSLGQLEVTIWAN